MFQEKYFVAQDFININKFYSKWSAPSNIALVKYWGKLNNYIDFQGNKASQIPANPSISFTLSACKTITAVDFQFNENQTAFSFDFFFEGKQKDDFKPKIESFFNKIAVFCPYLINYHLTIHSENTFPHSSGIASSASGLAALAMNIMALEKKLIPSISEDYFYSKASFLARLGSGSASRSINGKVVVWGENKSFEGSSNLFGFHFNELHRNFKNYQDTILLVDKGEKVVSSSVGHDLMHNHPFATERFHQAHQNLEEIKQILKTGDLNKFVKLVESEALTLHAMMMTSMPYFILMKPNTLEIINKIWSFRNLTKIPVCFTLDAGANVHLLYPENEKVNVLKFIHDELVGYCQNGQYICDEIGNGAIQIL